MARVQRMDASAARNDEEFAGHLSLAHYGDAEGYRGRRQCADCRKTAAVPGSASKPIEPSSIEEASHCTANVFAVFDCARGLCYRLGLCDSDGRAVATRGVAQVSSR